MEVTPKAASKVRSVYSTPENTAEDGSPSGTSANKSQHKLSASLRERLIRSRRSFTSPFSVAKRLCVDEEEEGGRHVPAATAATVATVATVATAGTAGTAETAGTAADNNIPAIRNNVDLNRNELGSSIAGPAPEPCLDLTQQLEQLKREVKDKTETLRRLKMVKMYRSKNNLTQLQALIDKWRSCAQASLYELQSDATRDGKKASLSELIDLFGLEDGILHFDRAEDDFTT
ncbi:unnamed protein product [Knipowitschia caucasica]|uniref:Swi5-dependent recombination DNA repair protein 1 homolog n=1 Tax=Knipowitschia caucasica TaxID=637954 RepID=A0AAV2JLR4_KNICA